MFRAHRAIWALVLASALVALGASPAFAPPSGGGGGGSGSSTAATFVDYAQCANGAPPSNSLACPDGWINGILQASNSHYHEDEVTPQRLEVTVPAGGPATGRTLTLSYMARKGSAPAHAYDSLATWDYTQSQADRCQGLTVGGKSPTCVLPGAPAHTNLLPACTGSGTVAPCTFPMQSDPTPVVPVGSGVSPVTSAHELPQSARQWVIYGGSITAASVPVHDAASDPASDDFATVTVTYRLADANGDGKVDADTNVQLLFGGHLAVSTGLRGWGANLGSGNISGGPYHIKLGPADGSSLGSKDNQIMSAAIVAGSPSFVIDKTASPAVASPGQTVTYTITVTNNGTAAGATSFVDDYNDAVTILTVPSGCNNNSPVTGQMSCTTGTIAAGGGTQVFTYTASMPSTFTGTPGAGCSTNQYPVTNTATLANGLSDPATVCVNAAPTFTVSKAANPTTANPGQTVTYTITVSNTGSAPGSTTFTDDYDDRLDSTLSAVISNPTGGTCTKGTVNGTKGFNCTTSSIDPGKSQTFTYTATMPATFTGPAGGSGCSSTQYPVTNTATVPGATPSSATVCVNAAPAFTVSKSVDKTTASPGDTVTYTVTVRNGGSAPGSTTFTDDYDDRLDSTLSAVTSNPTGGSCTKGTVNGTKGFNCTTSSIDPGLTQVFTYTAQLPSTFTGTPPTGCGTGQYPVINTVQLANGQSATGKVCVNAAPAWDVTKTADPTTSSPNGVVTYTITVKNIGTAPGSTQAKDTYDGRVTISGLPAACTNDTTAHVVTCTTGTVNPGNTASFQYQGTMPATFSGTSGGSGCSTGQYPVINTVTVPGDSASATVCVNAKPNLTLAKSANVTATGTGSTITYTLTYGNSGPASASGVVLVEDLPAGTTFAGCTGGCTNSPTQATWTMNTVPAGGGGTVSLTVLVTATDRCSICNTAKISSPDFNGGTPLNSNTVCVPSTPAANPAGAHASGDSLGAKVVTTGLVGLQTTDLSTSATSQSGVGGPQLDDETVLSAQVPSGGSVLKADVLRTTSASVATASPAEARDTSVAEVTGVCLLPVGGICTVESSTVRAVASAVATGTSASASDAGSTIENLKIVGLATPVDLNAPLHVDLNPLVFGAGSYVDINGRQQSVTTPSGTSGGTYAADLTVTMIHLHVTGLLAVQAADVTVAKAHAHADFPQLLVCSPTNNQSVSGHALVASLFTTLPLANAVQGYVGIPASGGSQSSHIVDLSVPAGGSIASAKTADSSSVGSLTASQSKSDSIAEVAGDNKAPACVLKSPTSCLISAKVLHSESHSSATAAGATSADTNTAFTNLTVLGIPIAVPVAPNTTIALPGIGFVVLNEQFCDNGARASHSCAGTTHSGLTVRSIRVVVLQGNNVLGLPPGVDLIISEAHADATFG